MMEISLVIPSFNGSRYIEELYRGLTKVMIDLNKDYEIIFINDGSTDDTLAILNGISANDKRTKIVNFITNSGQYAALSAGIDISKGNIVITIDDDFKNFQADIPRLLKQIYAGYDIITSWRINRQETFWGRIVPSYMINIFVSIVIGKRIHDIGCSLKVFTRKVAIDMRNYNEVIQFIPQLKKYKIKEIRVDVLSAGNTRYGFLKLIKNAFAIILICFKCYRHKNCSVIRNA